MRRSGCVAVLGAGMALTSLVPAAAMEALSERDLAAVQGPRIDPQRLAAGDLVFFGSRGNVTHVGIYVGEGRFVHAPSTGGTVRLDSLSGPYWKDHYTGAKRVLR